jgi:hypothetical protein
MAPEVLSCPERSDAQLHKDRNDLAYGTAADVWAVGALAHELLTVASPFLRLTQQQMVQVRNVPVSAHIEAFRAWRGKG